MYGALRRRHNGAAGRRSGCRSSPRCDPALLLQLESSEGATTVGSSVRLKDRKTVPAASRGKWLHAGQQPRPSCAGGRPARRKCCRGRPRRALRRVASMSIPTTDWMRPNLFARGGCVARSCMASVRKDISAARPRRCRCARGARGRRRASPWQPVAPRTRPNGLPNHPFRKRRLCAR